MVARSAPCAVSRRFPLRPEATDEMVGPAAATVRWRDPVWIGAPRGQPNRVGRRGHRPPDLRSCDRPDRCRRYGASPRCEARALGSLRRAPYASAAWDCSRLRSWSAPINVNTSALHQSRAHRPHDIARIAPRTRATLLAAGWSRRRRHLSVRLRDGALRCALIANAHSRMTLLRGATDPGSSGNCTP